MPELSLFAAIDQYCERLDASLTAEPLNAVSNLSFIVAAIALHRLAKARLLQSYDSELGLRALIAMIFTVGIGSALFHTVAVTWTKWADVIPIIAALLIFLHVFLRRVARVGAAAYTLSFAAFAAASAFFASFLPKETFNESNNYFACTFALVAMGWFLTRRGSPQAKAFYYAAAVFTVSLICRTVDLLVCDSFPSGTHFLWHLLNGVCLYLATKAVIDELAEGSHKS